MQPFWANPPGLDSAAIDANYLRRDGTNTMDATLPFGANNTYDIGSESVRARRIWCRQLVALGGDGVIDASFQGGASGPNHGGIIAGSQNLVGTQSHNMDSANTAFPAVALIGNTYNAYASSTCIFENTGGGASQFGSAYTTYGGITSTIRTTAFGALTAVYAWAYGGDVTVLNEASGALTGGYPASNTAGGSVTQRTFAQAQGMFHWCRAPYGVLHTGLRNSNGRGAGSFLLSLLEGSGSGTMLAQTNVNSKANFVVAHVEGAGTNQSQVRTGNAALAAFVVASTNAATELARAEATGDGSSTIGRAIDAIMSCTGDGGRVRGIAEDSNDITCPGKGGSAQGASSGGLISATGENSNQFGPGLNSAPISVGVGDISGDGLRLIGGGAPGTPQNGDFWKASGDVNFHSNGATVGPFNQPNVTGSRAGNAALASLLTTLANLNIIADGTTA